MDIQPVPQADRWLWLEAALGQTVVFATELTDPWPSSTTTFRVRLGSGDEVIVQWSRDRPAMERRVRLGQLLPHRAPDLPLPEIVLVDRTGSAAVLVTRSVTGQSARASLGDDAGAARIGRLMGSLIPVLRRAPIAGLRLSRLWSQPRQLLTRSRIWADGATPLLDLVTATRLTRLLDRAPELLSDGPFVLAHGDLVPVNVLVDEDRVVALLDFEDARAAPLLYDAATFRRTIRHHHRERWAVLGDAFFAAAEIDASGTVEPTLDLLGVLQCLEAMQRAPVGAKAGRAGWALQIAEILDR